MQHKIAIAILLGAGALQAQCATSSPQIRSFDPWAASFYYFPAAGETLNQYLDLTVDAPVTVSAMQSTCYNQFAAGGTTPPDQQGNVAEVRIYTTPTTHIGVESTPASWTHVATAEMTIVAWNGDSTIQNFKDPVSNLPSPFVLPAGTYGFCIEYIPTDWSGTVLLPQTNVPLLNPGQLSVIGVDPGLNYPVELASDEFITIGAGGIQAGAWQVVDPLTGALGPNPTIVGVLTDQPNLGFDYTADPNAGTSASVGPGCYNSPFMLHEVIPANSVIDLVNTSYTMALTPSANGGFYTISQGGIPYLPPPASATNLTQGGTAAVPVANSSASLDDCTFDHTLLSPLPVPSPGGSLQATHIGINSNGKLYFDTAAPTDTSFNYNGSNYGSLADFADLPYPQWCVFNTDFDPSVGGDIYVMEPSPNFGGVMIWWDNVPNWPAVAGVTNSMSIEFTADGSVGNIAFGGALANDGGGNDAIVGFSAGNGEPIGGAIDWSAIPAAPGAQLSGDGSSAPTLDLSARPVTGTTFDFVLGNLPDPLAPGIPRLGIFALSSTAFPLPGGLDLGVIGMPGCPLYIGANPIVLTGIENPAAPGDIRLSFTIPAGTPNQSLYIQGLAQNAVLPPNSFGFTISNGVCWQVGSL